MSENEQMMSNKILEVKWIDKKIVKVKLKATKRRTLWMKVEKTDLPINFFTCTPKNCQLYYECSKMKSPLRKFYNFAQFCNHLFREYPELKDILGITSINQVIPIKRIGT